MSNYETRVTCFEELSSDVFPGYTSTCAFIEILPACSIDPDFIKAVLGIRPELLHLEDVTTPTDMNEGKACIYAEAITYAQHTYTAAVAREYNIRDAAYRTQYLANHPKECAEMMEDVVFPEALPEPIEGLTRQNHDHLAPAKLFSSFRK